MPYTAKQCRYFAVAAKQGKNRPKDWRKKCKKEHQKRSTQGRALGYRT